MRIAAAAIHLASRCPEEAIELLAPVTEPSVESLIPTWAAIHALLFDAAAREEAGDRREAEASLERALDLAEPEGLILPFTIIPVEALLERYQRHRTAHAALLSTILDVRAGESARPRGESAPLDELSAAELRVIRYLPSNLKAPEIAAELFVSTNTIRTHLRHIYASSTFTAAPRRSPAPGSLRSSHHPTTGAARKGSHGWREHQEQFELEFASSMVRGDHPERVIAAHSITRHREGPTQPARITMSTSNARHRVVIVGSRFGGLAAAKALRRAPVEVTVIERTNQHLFQPLLYQTATGIVGAATSPPDLGHPPPPLKYALAARRRGRRGPGCTRSDVRSRWQEHSGRL